MSTVHEQFDRVATEYDFMSTLMHNNDFFLSNLSANRGSALDIGCGSGVLTFELAKHYDEVVGIDISKELLAIATQKRSAPNITYVEMDADRLDLDRKFDLIVSRTTFHHLSDIRSTLDRLKDLISPEGKIVILDNVSETETPPAIMYIIGALIGFFPYCLKFGLSNAMRILKFSISGYWLRHLASDRYLSEENFRELYGSVLPECSFVRLDYFMGIVWENG